MHSLYTSINIFVESWAFIAGEQMDFINCIFYANIVYTNSAISYSLKPMSHHYKLNSEIAFLTLETGIYTNFDMRTAHSGSNSPMTSSKPRCGLQILDTWMGFPRPSLNVVLDSINLMIVSCNIAEIMLKWCKILNTPNTREFW